MTDAEDWAEERAAIVQEGNGCTRWLAEQTVAQWQGFKTWGDMMRAIRKGK